MIVLAGSKDKCFYYTDYPFSHFRPYLHIRFHIPANFVVSFAPLLLCIMCPLLASLCIIKGVCVHACTHPRTPNKLHVRLSNFPNMDFFCDFDSQV